MVGARGVVEHFRAFETCGLSNGEGEGGRLRLTGRSCA